jgi:hypothetical protein
MPILERCLNAKLRCESKAEICTVVGIIGVHFLARL